ncbi:MAG: hypothetical protein IT180_02920 [Acidobacteria bacterium]|nr:hypothetical protein [Acidobacteriota bacterium]
MVDWTGASTLSVRSALVAGLAGFLTRPCCVLPAVLALGGTSSAALTHSVVAHRPLFLAASVVLLAGSLWMNVRWQTRPFNKWLAVVAAAASFGFAAAPDWTSSIW